MNSRSGVGQIRSISQSTESSQRTSNLLNFYNQSSTQESYLLSNSNNFNIGNATTANNLNNSFDCFKKFLTPQQSLNTPSFMNNNATFGSENNFNSFNNFFLNNESSSNNNANYVSFTSPPKEDNNKALFSNLNSGSLKLFSSFERKDSNLVFDGKKDFSSSLKLSLTKKLSSDFSKKIKIFYI